MSEYKERYPRNCPHCDADLDGGDIYESFISMGKSEEESLEIASGYGWSKETPYRFSNIVGQVDLIQDRITHYTCPECEKTINLNPA